MSNKIRARLVVVGSFADSKGFMTSIRDKFAESKFVTDIYDELFRLIEDWFFDNYDNGPFGDTSDNLLDVLENDTSSKLILKAIQPDFSKLVDTRGGTSKSIAENMFGVLMKHEKELKRVVDAVAAPYNLSHS